MSKYFNFISVEGMPEDIAVILNDKVEVIVNNKSELVDINPPQGMQFIKFNQLTKPKDE